MAENSKIEWCDDTVGFWWGCQERGPECVRCYARDGYSVSIAESQTGRRLWASNRESGDQPDVRMKVEGAAETLRRLNRKAEREGRPRIVFVNSQADTFEDTDAVVVRRLSKKVAAEKGRTYEIAYEFEGGIRWHSPEARIGGLRLWTLDDERREMFRAIDDCLWLRCLLLTKRPENIRRMWPTERIVDIAACYGGGRAACADLKLRRDNVWLGTSCGHPDSMDRVSALAECCDLAPVRFVSAEPMLAAIDFHGNGFFCTRCGGRGEFIGPFGESMIPCDHQNFPDAEGAINWIIVGGESGPGARPMHQAWARSIRDQCQAAGVPFFFKQWGEWLPESLADWSLGQVHEWCEDETSFRHGYLARKYAPERMRLLDGREHNELPTLEHAR